MYLFDFGGKEVNVWFCFVYLDNVFIYVMLLLFLFNEELFLKDYLIKIDMLYCFFFLLYK